MKIKILTTNDCTFCLLAKKLLENRNLKYEEIKLEKNIQMFKKIKIKYNYHTVPIIFINEKFIGGYNELKKFIN